MRTSLRLAEERRPARRAESPMHLVAAVRDTQVIAGLTRHRERRRKEAGVDCSVASTDVLALPTPAHARDNRGRRAFPANRATEASACYRHSVRASGNTGHVDCLSYVGEDRSRNCWDASASCSPSEREEQPLDLAVGVRSWVPLVDEVTG